MLSPTMAVVGWGCLVPTPMTPKEKSGRGPYVRPLATPLGARDELVLPVEVQPRLRQPTVRSWRGFNVIGGLWSQRDEASPSGSEWSTGSDGAQDNWRQRDLRRAPAISAASVTLTGRGDPIA